jgi:esterase
VARVMVVDIAPVANPPRFGPLLAAMRDLPLRPGMTRGEAEAGLAAAVPEAGLRAFLMQNFVPGPAPGWRVGLGGIIAGMDEILGWPRFAGRYDGPALFLAGERSDYLLAEHRAGIRALFPRARFATLKGAGHWVHADNPEGFVGVAAAFLG